MRRALAVLIAVCVACGSYGDEDETSPPPAPAAVVDGGADAMAPGNEAGVDPCAGKIVYVSADGSDLNSGCEPGKPKHTIGAAVGYLASGSFTGYEIHVCRGTYAEEVTLNIPASIRGSYECSTWKQDTDLANPPNRTIVQPASGERVLTVTGAAINDAVLIEGLTLRAPSVATGKSSALVIEDKAAPHVAWIDALGGNVASGANVVTNGVGDSISYALRTTTGASPRIEHAKLKGGDATCTAGCNAGFGTVGVWFGAGSGTPSIVDSTIEGGKATFAEVGSSTRVSPSVGFVTYVAMPAERAFARNVVTLGGGEAQASTVSLGIVSFADIEIDQTTVARNSVKIRCTGSAASDICYAISVYAVKGANVKMTRVTMQDPDIDATHPGRHGVQVTEGAKVTMDASAIYLSNPGSESRALVIADKGGTISAHGNTFVTGALAFAQGGVLELSDNIHVQTFAPYVAPTPPGTPNPTPQTMPPPVLDVRSCDGSTTKIALLTNNVFVQGAASAPDLLDAYSGSSPCVHTGTATTLKAAEAVLPSIASGNVIVRTDCASETANRCIACERGGDCVLAGWGANPYASTAAATLLAGGWALRTDISCKIANGGTTGLATFSPSDTRGVPRTAPFAVGAFESDACSL